MLPGRLQIFVQPLELSLWGQPGPEDKQSVRVHGAELVNLVTQGREGERLCGPAGVQRVQSVQSAGQDAWLRPGCPGNRQTLQEQAWTLAFWMILKNPAGTDKHSIASQVFGRSDRPISEASLREVEAVEDFGFAAASRRYLTDEPIAALEVLGRA